MTQTTTQTLNGATTYKDSGNPLVDFFFSAGALRRNPENAIPLFDRALDRDLQTAIRILLYIRDTQEGQGERAVYRCLLNHLAKTRPEIASQLFLKTVQLGRFDDILFAYADTPIEEEAYNFYLSVLQGPSTSTRALAAKWAPREKSANHHIARKLLRYSGLSPKAYRKLLVNSSSTVENALCAKALPGTDYSKVPALASSRYQAAFIRNDFEGYTAYKEALKTNQVAPKTSGLYPYDVAKASLQGDPEVAQAQWDNLPDLMPADVSIFPLVDTSSSMHTKVGPNGGPSALDVAVSLGIYIAKKQKTAFADTLLTFHSDPELVSIKNQDLHQSLNTLYSANWGGSTNIAKAFDQLLTLANTFKVSPEDMPKYLIIFSDMQFNEATYGSDYNTPLMNYVREAYKESGYALPRIIFWNLVDYGSNTPVSFDQEGTALVSGFSTSLLKSLFQNLDSLTPIMIMHNAITHPRYSFRL